MIDYDVLRANNWKLLPEPDPEPDEEQEGQQPVVVDVVYNVHEIAGKSKTIALKLSLRIPTNS
jgi:hypothetical protein